MRYALRLLSFLCLLAGCDGPSTPPDGGGGADGGPLTDAASDAGPGSMAEVDGLRVVTFNLDGLEERPWSERRATALPLLRSLHADIVMLQEATPDQLREIQVILPTYAVIDAPVSGATDAPVNAVLYNSVRLDADPAHQGGFWFSDTPDVPGSVSWGAPEPTSCAWARLIDRRSGHGFAAFAFELSELSSTARERSVELLLERIDTLGVAEEAVVVGGATWIDETSPEGSTLFAALTDALTLADASLAGVGTDHGYAGGTDGPRVDHVLLSPSIVSSDASVLTPPGAFDLPSDHHPLSVLLHSWALHEPDAIPSPPSPSGPTDGPVELMSFNVRQADLTDGENYWTRRLDVVASILADHRPDVVGLQEANRLMVEELLAELGGGDYALYFGQSTSGREASGGCPVLFNAARFRVDEPRSGTRWLSSTPLVPGSHTIYDDTPRVVTWVRLIEVESERAFVFFNVHLDNDSRPARQEQAMHLLTVIESEAGTDTRFLAGDLNAGEGSPTVRGILATGLVDTFRVAHPDQTQSASTSGWFGRLEGEKIDYVLTPPAIDVLDAEIVRDNDMGRYPSDHYPVRARIEL